MNSDVIIVGAGPVGLMLACELRVHGVRTTVLEARTTVDNRVRAPAITIRTIEAMDRRGLLDEPAHPTPHALPIRQADLERLLEKRAGELGTDLRRGHEVVDLHQDEAGVEVRVRELDGTDYRLTAAYLVGCDGGRSLVRKAVGFAFPGSEPTLTGYQAEVTVEDNAGLRSLRTGWHRTPAGVMAFMPEPDGHRIVSIEFDGPPADRDEPVRLAEVEASFRRTSQTRVRLTNPRSLTRFTDNARLAEPYRIGRVLLAGDAAHVHAPFGGQGLNLGMQDASNLGWKLAGQIAGWAPAGLLDSYQAERRPVAAEVQRNVRTAISLVNPKECGETAYELFQELKALDPVKRYLHEKTAMVNVRYESGEHPLLGRAIAGGRLTEAMRTGRAVLLDSSDNEELAQVAAEWRDRVDVVTARCEQQPDDVAALLVRPDGYVCWVALSDGRVEPSPLRDALIRWFGAS